MSQEIKLQGGDIALQGGRYHLVEKNEKLEQQTLKIILSEKGFNLFNPEYGTRIYDAIGRYQGALDVGEAVIRKDIKNALVHYQEIQIQQEFLQELDDEEVLLEIQSVNITRVRPDIYNVDVQTTDRTGQNFNITANQAMK